MKRTTPLFAILIFLILIHFFSCSQEKKDHDLDIVLLEAPYCEAYQEDKRNVIRFLTEYLNNMFEASVQERNSLWHSEVLKIRKDRSLRSNWYKEDLLESPPKLLGVRKENDTSYYVTLQFDYLKYPLKIMNLKIVLKNGNYQFVDLFGGNLKTTNLKERDGYKFYYSKHLPMQDSLELEAIAFNNYLADFFETETVKFSTIVTQSMKEYFALRGYDYTNRQTLDNQNGGQAISWEKIIFSGNGTPYYPHEIVHLYSSTRFNCHSWFDEGLATYLGGSAGKPLDYHICKLQSHLNDLNFNSLLKMTTFDFETDYRYAIGGLIVKLIIEEYGGKDQLFELMNKGWDDENYYEAVYSVFNIDENELDSFLKKKIENHECLQ